MAKRIVSSSAETINEAEKVAKSTQRPGQSKEQTKLIAQGIQKGIEQYKKQHKAKLRDADKHKKKQQKAKAQVQDVELKAEIEPKPVSKSILPWSLLIISWLSFAVYFYLGA